MKGATIVCILGMHRSGTSVLARLLNLLGVYLGPDEHLMQPGSDNPKGFWEHKEIQKLDDEILAMLGGSWHQPPDFPEGWECSTKLAGVRERAAKIINADFGEVEIWGWKDPRTCLSLPFWQQLLSGIVYVVCLRHPLEVARSLEQRNGFSVEKSLYLWLVYLEAILRTTSPGNRCIVLYEELLENSQHELRRLAEYLGLAERAKEEGILEAARAFIDRDLQHHSRHSSCLTPVSDDMQALAAAEEIYRSCSQHVALQADDMAEQLDSLLNMLEPVVRMQEMNNSRREKVIWDRKIRLTRQDIDTVIPPGSMFILVDECKLEFTPKISGRRIVRFLEYEGEYWGQPENDSAAIRELKRLQGQGAEYIVFSWPSFWWLDFYSDFSHHLHNAYCCLLKNDRLVVFDLRSGHTRSMIKNGGSGHSLLQ
jgi:hypothetical protein